MANEKKRYNNMENVLQFINKNFVSLADNDVKAVNPVLQAVLEKFIAEMKSTSVLFDSIYENNFYGGSYYDGLKVGKPEEFDLDLCFRLPKQLNATVTISNEPGFVHLQVPGWTEFEKSNNFAKYKDLGRFKDSSHYLEYTGFLRWMESVVNTTLNKFERRGNETYITVNGKLLKISVRKSGPAFTFNIQFESRKFDVDLVPVFRMPSEQWPPSPFKRLPLPECANKKEFLLVPKPPKTNVGKPERLWRLSFQEQERILINSRQNCKPVIRLLKKLRDKQNHNKISSYFIKTIFLFEIDKRKHDGDFWNSSLSFVFMQMLKIYRDALSNRKIPYYWNERNNLLKNIDPVTIDNFKNFLTRVIDSIDRKVDTDPLIVAEHLSTIEERAQLNEMEILCKINKKENESACCVDRTNNLGNSSGNINTQKTNETHSDVEYNIKMEVPDAKLLKIRFYSYAGLAGQPLMQEASEAEGSNSCVIF